jgi:hypothetical protein
MREPDLMLQGYRISQISEIGLLYKDLYHEWRLCCPGIDAKDRSLSGRVGQPNLEPLHSAESRTASRSGTPRS